MDRLQGMTEFRAERSPAGVVHLVFDSPGRPMNVFSNKAIADLGLFADWLPGSDAKGVVIRSGKTSAFCAGADLNELGVAYDMIMAAPSEERGRVAFDHFFRLSLALRRLETAGKPVAAAIAGLALGGGGELALAAHHRVMVDDPKVAFGLPESLVGLLPGGGGTQRLPRRVGIAAALPILLDGGRLAGQAALDAGVVDQLVAAGDEVAAAERWVLLNPTAAQPWDKAGWRSPDATEVSETIVARRSEVLETTQGHYPAPLAILDCVARGLPQPFDAAIRTEMEIFSQLIQRREPRNMIRTLFLGRLDQDRLRKAGGVGPDIEAAVAAVTTILKGARDDALAAASARAGFGGPESKAPPAFDGVISQDAFWHEAAPATDGKIKLRAQFAALDAAAAEWRPRLTDEQRRAADYMLVKDHGFPAYLGGVFANGRRLMPATTTAKQEMTMAKPLAGIRVLDLSKVLAGPLCAQYLGDLGADVIKVETVGAGDETRGWPPFPAPGLGTVFLSANRNKRSIAVDLKTEKGRGIVHALAKSADVAIESFGTGVAERLGIDAATLRPLNDRLIHCSISGFGRSGPLKNSPGYDVILQAFCGIMSMTGDADGGYIRSPISPIDQMTGVHAFSGILALLYAREKTGQGGTIQVSLFETALGLLGYNLQTFWERGVQPPKCGSSHESLCPYQAFEAADGPIMIGVANDNLWRKFCGVVGLDDIVDDLRFRTNADRVSHRDETIARVQSALSQKPAAHWNDALSKVGVPCSPIHTLAQLTDHAHTQASDVIVAYDHAVAGPLKGVGHPVLINGQPRSAGAPPPMHGQHTADILADLGLSDEEIDQLRRDRIVG